MKFKRTISALAVPFFALQASALVVGCSDATRPAAEAAGRLDLPLTATGPSGALYRLAATFGISGPQSLLLMAEGDAPSINQALMAGDYEVELLAGWSLMRQHPDEQWRKVEAELQGTSTRGFAISSDTTTPVTFSFLAGDEIITFGDGTLELTIQVDEAGVSEPSCDDGAKNGGETDVDCGGDCVPCGAGAMCITSADCAAGSCALGICGTLVSGVMAEDTLWSAAESPYVLGGPLQVGATLTIGPGARVLGGDATIEVHGRLNIAGTSEQPALLQRVHVSPRGSHEQPTSVEIVHARFEGGAPYNYTSNNGGTLQLRDSVMIGTQPTIMAWPSGACSIERNLFLQTGEILVVSSFPVAITENYFFEQTPWMAAIWAAVAFQGIEVHGNTFASTDRVAIQLGTAETLLAVNATGNYWGTTDPVVIDRMIVDRHDDLNINQFVPFEPFLTSPNPSAPTPPATP